MLRQRVLSGILLASAVFAAVVCDSLLWGFLILLTVSAIASWEFYTIAATAGLPNFRWVGVIGGLLLLGATWSAASCGSSCGASMEGVVLLFLTGLTFIRQFPQKNNDQPLQTIAATLLGVLYVPFLLTFLAKLLVLGGGDGRILVLYLIVVVKCTDMGAYFVGCAFGRHKMFPRISPAKSWEGVAGGILGGIGASFLMFWLNGYGDFGVVQFGARHALMLGLLLSVGGIVGDLAESLLKRAAGVKDSGRAVLGMGGVLDIVDSLLFAAPVLYVYCCFVLGAC